MDISIEALLARKPKETNLLPKQLWFLRAPLRVHREPREQWVSLPPLVLR